MVDTEVQIRLACDRICLPPVSEDEVPKLFTPGEDIPTCAGFMRCVICLIAAL